MRNRYLILLASCIADLHIALIYFMFVYNFVVLVNFPLFGYNEYLIDRNYFYGVIQLYPFRLLNIDFQLIHIIYSWIGSTLILLIYQSVIELRHNPLLLKTLATKAVNKVMVIAIPNALLFIYVFYIVLGGPYNEYFQYQTLYRAGIELNDPTIPRNVYGLYQSRYYEYILTPLFILTLTIFCGIAGFFLLFRQRDKRNRASSDTGELYPELESS